MNDVKKYIYGTLIIFVFGLLLWISFIFVNACGFTTNCISGKLIVERTSIPTLIPATLPAANLFVKPAATAEATVEAGSDIARPSNPGGPGPSVDLVGDVNSGKQIFETNCSVCHMPEGVGGHINPGSDDGTVPALNPIDDTLKSPDYKTYATNIDLFIEHGSKPAGPNPVFQMPAWGDQKILTHQQIADVTAYVISLNPVAETSATVEATPAAGSGVEIARPSNAGGPGAAIDLTGNTDAGKLVFESNCSVCHMPAGVGGHVNPGSDDGTVPALNPIDSTLISPDYKTYATNIDLFIEHGSKPAGPNPVFQMPAWGDLNILTPQQIADVIAYIISLNH
jgi:mono/diheme cytochrome c family protein